MLEPTRDSRPDRTGLPTPSMFVASIAILVLVAAAMFLRAGLAEWGDLEAAPRKSIALVRADDSAVHLIETRGGAVAAETPSNGNGKLERAIGI